MSKFKIGDKVKVVGHTQNSSDGRAFLGQVGIVIRTEDDWVKLDLARDGSGVWDRELELYDDKAKKVKELPIVKHLILQDSCGNFIAVKNSEKDAIEYAKAYNKESLTIYRMVEVAKVSNERKVVKVKAKRVKK